MVDKKQPKAKLNSTLLFISKLFHEHDITNWFIAYGTLLGIIRENSCIDMDDDIDLICNGEDYNKIKQILSDAKITFCYKHNIGDSKNILKTNGSAEYTSIDIYMAKIEKDGTFNDLWNKVKWSQCYIKTEETDETEETEGTKDNKLMEYTWNNTILYLPNNYETKIVRRYGKNWRIPANSKGPLPMAKIL